MENGEAEQLPANEEHLKCELERFVVLRILFSLLFVSGSLSRSLSLSKVNHFCSSSPSNRFNWSHMHMQSHHNLDAFFHFFFFQMQYGICDNTPKKSFIILMCHNYSYFFDRANEKWSQHQQQNARYTLCVCVALAQIGNSNGVLMMATSSCLTCVFIISNRI